jgi:NAD-dependent DNA ligase
MKSVASKILRQKDKNITSEQCLKFKVYKWNGKFKNYFQMKVNWQSYLPHVLEKFRNGLKI